MKKNLLFCSLVIAAFGFTSCSSDDDNNNNNDVEIEGTYHLTEVNTEDATDFDQDGTPHINQMDESDCYDEGKITLNADNTFTYVMTGILVDEAAGTAGCAEDNTVSGTWEIVEGVGEDAIIEATYEDNNGDDVTVMFTKQGDMLTLMDNNIFSEYADRNEEGGAIYTLGSTEYVFEK